MSLTYDAFAASWWPYLFILLAGGVATHAWRWLGVLAGARLKEASEALILVRAVATALVAAVVGTLIMFPSGELAATPVALRIGAAAAGWLAFLAAGKSVITGVLTAELLLIGGWMLMRAG